MPSGAWWKSLEKIEEVEQKCDVITLQARKLGFWLIGSANNWLRPDAIVIPPWKTHVKYIKMRERNYDGGARSDSKSLAQVQCHRRWILSWARKGVPRFDSVEDAVNYLVG
jgi:hypothetical protein